MVWEIGDVWRFWMIPNWYLKIKGGAQAHLDQFGIVQNLQTSPIPQTIFLVGTFFAISYSKKALEAQLFWMRLLSL